MSHVKLSLRPAASEARLKQNDHSLIEFVFTCEGHEFVLELPRYQVESLLDDVRVILDEEERRRANREQMSLFARMGEPL